MRLDQLSACPGSVIFPRVCGLICPSTMRAIQPAMIESPYENAVRDFLRVAVEELDCLRAKITPNYFHRVADLIEQTESSGGRVHVTGIGKPEYVSGYIAALLSSTGTPAYFLHGTECVHGSAGQVKRGDVV